LSWPFRYRDTVDAATPAARATSWIVANLPDPLPRSIA
jgi:hypothetical protein